MSDRRTAIVEGSIPRALVSLAVPLVAQNVVRVAQQVIDTFWLGRLGETAVAAVGLTIPVTALLFALLVTPFVGTQILVSQRVGADDDAGARRIVIHGVVLAVLLGAAVGAGVAAATLVALGAVQWVVPGPVARLFVPDASPEGITLTVDYLRILAYGYPAIGAADLLLSGFNGAGRTRTSFVADLLKYWVVRLPVATLALPATASVTVLGVAVAPGVDLGMPAVFWAVTGSNVVAALGVGVYYVHAVRGGLFVDASVGGDDADAATAGSTD